MIAPPTGPLGSGIHGGVNSAIKFVERSLIDLNHSTNILCASGSRWHRDSLITLSGRFSESAQLINSANTVDITSDHLIHNYCEFVIKNANNYSGVINFSFDAPLVKLYKDVPSHFFQYLSMTSVNEEVELVLGEFAKKHPGKLGVLSEEQVDSFQDLSHKDCHIISGCIVLDHYEYNGSPGKNLAWVGRISPEKNLEIALEVANLVDRTLDIIGFKQDKKYWNHITRDYPKEGYNYHGFLETKELQKILGNCSALIHTSGSFEAMGRAIMEAQACGVPVISFAQGGPKSLIVDEVTGFLVHSTNEMKRAVEKLNLIERSACRHHAESNFSFGQFADRVKTWLNN